MRETESFASSKCNSLAQCEEQDNLKVPRLQAWRLRSGKQMGTCPVPTGKRRGRAVFPHADIREEPSEPNLIITLGPAAHLSLTLISTNY